jgi:hypothetical protein
MRIFSDYASLRAKNGNGFATDCGPAFIGPRERLRNDILYTTIPILRTNRFTTRQIFLEDTTLSCRCACRYGDGSFFD